MSNLKSTTDSLNVEHPEHWVLLLALRASELQWAAYDTEATNTLVAGTLPLDLTAGSYLKALENAVYDNTALLNDWKQVRLVADAERMMIMPKELEADDDLALDALQAAYPNAQGDWALCAMPRCQALMGFELPEGVLSFLQRTWNMPQIVGRLYPMAEHYAAHDRERTGATMHLNLQPDKADVVVIKDNRLLLANTYSLRSTADAAYFALHAWLSCGLDARHDEMLVTGPLPLRQELLPQLRTRVSYVMPAIFPAAALKIGQDAVKAPLHLMLLALCE